MAPAAVFALPLLPAVLGGGTVRHAHRGRRWRTASSMSRWPYGSWRDSSRACPGSSTSWRSSTAIRSAQFFRKFLLPSIASGIGVVAFFCFMFSWVELLLAKTLTSVDAKPIAATMTRTASTSGYELGLPGGGRRADDRAGRVRDLLRAELHRQRASRSAGVTGDAARDAMRTAADGRATTMSWMAWTWQTAVFFGFIGLLLAGMSVWEWLSPGGAPRRANSRFRTTRGRPAVHLAAAGRVRPPDLARPDGVAAVGSHGAVFRRRPRHLPLGVAPESAFPAADGSAWSGRAGGWVYRRSPR